MPCIDAVAHASYDLNCPCFEYTICRPCPAQHRKQHHGKPGAKYRCIENAHGPGAVILEKYGGNHQQPPGQQPMRLELPERGAVPGLDIKIANQHSENELVARPEDAAHKRAKYADPIDHDKVSGHHEG